MLGNTLWSCSKLQKSSLGENCQSLLQKSRSCNYKTRHT